jgi:hypothetical protein
MNILAKSKELKPGLNLAVISEESTAQKCCFAIYAEDLDEVVFT